MTSSKKSGIIRIPIVKDGWRFILISLAITLIFLVLGWQILSAIAFLVTVFVASFFRDPQRSIPSGERLILSPADGKIISIQEVEIETAPGKLEKLMRIQIFLSIFNTHIQRAPTSGTVQSVKYNPGKFLNALNDKSSDENENNMIWMRSQWGSIGVKQIAGVIARRVVCKVRPDQRLQTGQRVGLIRFGSRTEAYFPPDAEIRAFVGQNVKAGLSILAEMNASALHQTTE